MFGLFWVPAGEWKETAAWKIKFRVSVKVNICLKLCIFLKSENVNTENEGAAGKTFLNFWILHFKMRKWMENKLWRTDLPLQTKLLKFQLPLTLAGGGVNNHPLWYAACDWGTWSFTVPQKRLTLVLWLSYLMAW